MFLNLPEDEEVDSGVPVEETVADEEDKENNGK